MTCPKPHTWEVVEKDPTPRCLAEGLADLSTAFHEVSVSLMVDIEHHLCIKEPLYGGSFLSSTALSASSRENPPRGEGRRDSLHVQKAEPMV